MSQWDIIPFALEVSGLFSFFKLSCYCCTWCTLWHLQKCLWYILVRFIPSIILYPPNYLLRIVLTGPIAPCSYKVHNSCTIFALIHPLCSLPSHRCQPPSGTSFTLMSFIFKKRYVCIVCVWECVCVNVCVCFTCESFIQCTDNLD
jgi:hypothetical protein